MKQKINGKLITLFLAGMAVGLVGLNLYLLPNSPDKPSVESPPNSEINKSLDHRIVVVPADASPNDVAPQKLNNVEKFLESGDRKFVIGNYAAALSSYRKYLDATQRRDAEILLRTAMCLERQSKFNFAIGHYQAAASQAEDDNRQALAIAGLARVFTQARQTDQAIELLANQANKLVVAGNLPELTRAQLSLQWARALQGRVVASALSKQLKSTKTVNYLADSPADLSYPNSLAEISTALDPDEFLSLVSQQAADSVPQSRNSKLGLKVIQRPSASAESISLSVSTDLQPVLAIFAQAENELQLKFQMSKQSASALTERSKSLEFEAVTLSSLLDRVLVPFGLIWYQRDDTIYMLTENEATQPLLSEFLFDSAVRAFRVFELEFPENKFRPAALMSRGRLSIMRGELAEANNLYQELAQIRPSGELQAKLFFNRAQLELMLQRPGPATSYLYKAIDQTLDANLEASSYCLLSRLHLAAGETGESSKTAGRALTTAVTVKQKSIAAISQARAYLFQQNPISANESLFRNKEYIQADGDSVVVASLLGAYAHAIGLSNKNRHSQQNAAIRMVTAVSNLEKTKQQSSFAEYYFSSLAYRKLGLRQLAIDMMTKALAKPDIGAWRRKLTYELGLLLHESARPGQALVALQGLTDQKDGWRVKALLQIAKIQASENQFPECIANCQLVLDSKPNKTQKQQTLGLLGTAYQSQGEHHIAALCFAGMLPGEF